MMTSNRPLDERGNLIGDVPRATAILDRFLHHAEIIRITGKSYRLRHQNQNRHEESEPPPAADWSSESAEATPNAAIADAGSEPRSDGDNGPPAPSTG